MNAPITRRNRNALGVVETADPKHLRVKITIEAYRDGMLQYPVRLPSGEVTQEQNA